MNHITVPTFYQTREKKVNKNKLLWLTWDIFNIDESGINVSNKPDCVIIENVSKMVMF